MKSVLPLALVLAFATTGCNTIENRRSLYSPKKADGPYTRSLRDGSWKKRKTVDQEFAEAQKRKRGPQIKSAAGSESPAAPQALPE